MTTGLGLIMPMATAIRNRLVQPAELLNEALLKERHDHEAATGGERPSLEETQQKFTQDRA